MKPKGQALQDKFYSKVQQMLVNEIIYTNNKPVVTDWNAHTFYITIDRVTFYIIPKDKYCLSEKYIYPCEKLFITNKTSVSEIYSGVFNPVTVTGNQFSNLLPNGEQEVKIELKFHDKILYIMEQALLLFPKQKILCMKTVEKSPVFVLSSLQTLLGGVIPLSYTKTT